ncbi:DUF2487 family protein [Xylanibacillus composti]|uniref:DUF2487 family protein n=1 Tax=Xylanibacillus composti TaxID=1572762 RepID=A0A8J4GYP5_9BACL|nr:DUF2487 family protein [Xylanibacillus composti]GIQ67574.1 hypothetical protein XYCOK13_03980 [Xylanibacillus composti]
MKFSDLDEQQWNELKPYLDTCVIPVTGLSGAEAPWQAVEGLERLRDWLDLVEQPFKGRIVTYPAMHYRMSDWEQTAAAVDELSRQLKQEQFRYVMVMSAMPWPKHIRCGAVDLHIDANVDESGNDLSGTVQEKVREMWNKKLPEDEC